MSGWGVEEGEGGWGREGLVEATGLGLRPPGTGLQLARSSRDVGAPGGKNMDPGPPALSILLQRKLCQQLQAPTLGLAASASSTPRLQEKACLGVRGLGRGVS